MQTLVCISNHAALLCCAHFCLCCCFAAVLLPCCCCAALCCCRATAHRCAALLLPLLLCCCYRAAAHRCAALALCFRCTFGVVLEGDDDVAATNPASPPRTNLVLLHFIWSAVIVPTETSRRHQLPLDKHLVLPYCSASVDVLLKRTTFLRSTASVDAASWLFPSNAIKQSCTALLLPCILCALCFSFLFSFFIKLAA